MDIKTFWLILILGVPLLSATLLVSLRRRIAPAAHWIAGIGVAVPVIATFALIPALYHGDEPALALMWIPALGIELDLHVDWLTLPFLMTEAGVSLLAVVYAWGYHHRDERTPIFYALLLLFAVGMAGTTLADDMFLFYVFWELMLVASCILILLWGDGVQRPTVALKYFIFTHLGSLLVLAALVMLYNAAGTDRFSVLRAGVSLPAAQVPWLITFFIIGFCVKMAIFPLHLWLPDAHTVAPMPVTIMLAAAMLSMGTYGILRFPLSLFTRTQMQPFALPLMVAGVISEIYGALMALAEQDVKRVVAYSSVSQMGYILFGLGTLTYNGIAGATLHVIFHAIVKALLFMVLGLVIHATGKRRVSELGGLGRAMPVTAFCAALGALAISATPPFCMFDSEWLLFSGGFATPYTFLTIVAVLGSLLTVAYALWLMGRIFLGPVPATESEGGWQVEKPPLTMLVPTVFLTVLALVEGLFPAPLYDWVAHELALLLGG